MKKRFVLSIILLSIFLISFVSALDIVSSNLYMVVDLSSGSVSYTDSAPSDLLTNLDYKTTKLVMKKVSAGTFSMGSPVGQPGRRTKFPPDTGETLHQVTLTNDYYVGVFKITQGQYQTIMGNNPSNDNRKGVGFPVVSVSWDQARGGSWPSNSWPGTPSSASFSGKLSSKTGIKFDLPTEAMWENTCKAGINTGLNNGKELSNIDEGNDVGGDGTYDANAVNICVGGFNTITNVGTKDPNTLGFYDFSCNGMEWVLDWTSTAYDLYDTSSSQTDPLGVSSQLAQSLHPEGYPSRMLKNAIFQGLGGARCADKSVFIWSTYSMSDHPEIYGPGFRIAASVPASASISGCTEDDWTYQLSSCLSSGQKTKTWIKVNSNCQNGVSHPANEIVTCTYNAPDDDHDGVPNDFDVCPNTAMGSNVSQVGCPLPYLSKFQVYSSSLSIKNLNFPVYNFEFGNSNGRIKFKDGVILVSGNNPLYLEDYTNILQNKISLDSSMLAGLNKPATLTFNNINFASPVVLKDGSRCSDCTISSYENGNLVVEVPHFTTYEVVDESYFNSTTISPPDPINYCKTNWQCGDWKECLNGNQARTCLDLNYCNDNSSKPSEFQSCSVVNETLNNSPVTPPVHVCIPNCKNIECGADNGCGEQCWICTAEQTCDINTNKCVNPSKFSWTYVIMGVMIIIAGGLGYYFFKIRKNKQAVTNIKSLPGQQIGKSVGIFYPRNLKK